MKRNRVQLRKLVGDFEEIQPNEISTEAGKEREGVNDNR